MCAIQYRFGGGFVMMKLAPTFALVFLSFFLLTSSAFAESQFKKDARTHGGWDVKKVEKEEAAKKRSELPVIKKTTTTKKSQTSR